MRCQHIHPERCPAFCRHGTDKELGCILGVQCTLFHPRLCPTSVSDRCCFFKRSCRLIHLKGTIRFRYSDGPGYSYSQKPYNGPTSNQQSCPRTYPTSRHGGSAAPTTNEAIRAAKVNSNVPITTPHGHCPPGYNLPTGYHSQPQQGVNMSFLVQLVERVKLDLLNHINLRLPANRSAPPTQSQPRPAFAMMGHPPVMHPHVWNRNLAPPPANCTPQTWPRSQVLLPVNQNPTLPPQAHQPLQPIRNQHQQSLHSQTYSC